MKNESTLHVRMPEELHLRLNEEANSKGISSSRYVRDSISNSFAPTNSYHSTDLLFLFAFIEYNREDSKSVCIYEVKHLLDIVNKHYYNLEIGMQYIFENVINGLKSILNDMEKHDDADEFTISFGKGDHDINFDFDKFYEFTNGRLPYR